MADEWYRDPGWAADDQVEFERRLARARPTSRAQYLAIKAAAPLGVGNSDGGRSLYNRVLAEYPDGWLFRVRALEALGDLSRNQGDLDAANDYYRQVLAVGRDGSGTSGMVEVSLAENLIRQGDEASLDEAMSLLAAWVTANTGGRFDSQLFRFQIALIRWVEARGGDADIERGRARAALALVGRGPVFPRHPTVGLVAADDDTLKWLRAIAE